MRIGKVMVKYLSHALALSAIGSMLSTAIFILLCRSNYLHSYYPSTGDYGPYFKFGNYVADFYFILLAVYSIIPICFLAGLFKAWRKPLSKISSVWIILLAIFILIGAIAFLYYLLWILALAIHFTTGDINPA
jgi:hypothetical protein